MFISFPEGYSDGIYITRFFHAVFHASPFGLSNRSRGPNRNKKKSRTIFLLLLFRLFPLFDSLKRQMNSP